MKLQLRRAKVNNLVFAGLLTLVVASASVASAQLVVNTLADSGPGSLRQAILDANSNPAADVITFAPGLAGLILLQSNLPDVTGIGDTIDGTGAGVIIDGSALPLPMSRRRVLHVVQSNVTIRGLTIQNVSGGENIRVEATSTATTVVGVVIDGNTITGDPTCIGSTTITCPRGIFVTGGTGAPPPPPAPPQEPGYTVEAAVTNNTVSIARTGILVFGSPEENSLVPDPGHNTVTVLIDGNTVGSSHKFDARRFGTGIGIMPGILTGSYNQVSATISNNTSKQNETDGILLAACGSASGASGTDNSLDVTVINNTVKDNVSTGIEVTAATKSSTQPPPPLCMHNTVSFEISGNTATGNTTNIDVHAGVGSSHDVQGSISNNTAKDSPAGDGIVVRGEGTSNTTHDITISGNVVTGNGDRGIIIQGGTSSLNAVLDGIDITGNTVKNNGSQGIQVSGGTNSRSAIISDVLIDGNISMGNASRGIFVTRGTVSTSPPSISLAGVTNNNASKNADDGILIQPNIQGSGTTPISGNTANSNLLNGIELKSIGYIVSNNTASSNAACGIILGGNADGGNIAKKNGQGDICP